MLSHIDSEEVHFDMSAPNRAGILTRSNGNGESEEDILMLVMPVMLNT